MSIHDICRISFSKLMGLNWAHHACTHSHTHHYVQIRRIYVKRQIKCYIQFITRYTESEPNRECTADNGHRTSHVRFPVRRREIAPATLS